MSKRQRLLVATSVFGVFGVLAIVGVFLMSMTPSAKAKTNNYPGIRVFSLDTGEEETFSYGIEPVLINRIGKEEFEVFDLIPRFEDPDRIGCLIKRTDKDWAESIENAEFYELCKGVYYDKDGKVLDPNYFEAKSMKKYDWKYENGFLYIQEDT